MDLSVSSSQAPAVARVSLKRMMGFEPTTFCMASRRSSQLSYIRARLSIRLPAPASLPRAATAIQSAPIGRTRVLLTLAGLIALLLVAAKVASEDGLDNDGDWSGGGSDDDAEPATQPETQQTAPEPAPAAEPEPTPPAKPPADPPAEPPAEPEPPPPAEPEPPAEPPSAAPGIATSVSHGEVAETDGVAQATLCVTIEVNPPEEGLAFDVVVTNVGSGVEFPPIASELGSSGNANVRTNLPTAVTYNVVVRVGEESQEHELEIVAGGESADCA